MDNHLTCYLTGNYVRTIWKKLAIEPLKSNTLFLYKQPGTGLILFSIVIENKSNFLVLLFGHI